MQSIQPNDHFEVHHMSRCISPCKKSQPCLKDIRCSEKYRNYDPQHILKNHWQSALFTYGISSMYFSFSLSSGSNLCLMYDILHILNVEKKFVQCLLLNVSVSKLWDYSLYFQQQVHYGCHSQWQSCFFLLLSCECISSVSSYRLQGMTILCKKNNQIQTPVLCKCITTKEY